MDKFESLPYRSKKRDRDCVSDSAFFPLPPQKRVNHNEDPPQPNAKPASPLTDYTEAMIRSPSPDGGVPIDEEALAKFPDYRRLVVGSDDSDDYSSSDEGSYDDHLSQGRLDETRQVAEPPQQRTSRPRRSAPHPSDSDHRYNINNDDQETTLPYASSLPVFRHQRGEVVVNTESSTRVYQPFRGLQSAEPLPTVTLNPRNGMAVEGGKLYLAQTLHHYYRKHIHCPHHGLVEGKPGHHRTAKKNQESGQVYRVWYCTSQPKWEGHRIDNTAYIELAKEQLDQKLFDRVLHELVRQLRSRDCQPVARNCLPQPDDFDSSALLSYTSC